jgi:hypothetical protein
MPTCPLCESTQAIGDVCETCGRPFSRSEAVPLPIAPLEDLELTRHASLADLPAAPLPELEPTAQRGSALAAPPEPVEGLVPTAAEPVQVEVAPLEVERVGDDAVLDLPATPGPIACRYCRTPAPAGERLCARCGMRLPLVRPPPRRAPDGTAPCRDCGTPMDGTQCPACGARRGSAR